MSGIGMMRRIKALGGLGTNFLEGPQYYVS